MIHPGEILLEEFIRPMDLSLAAVSRALGYQPPVSLRSQSVAVVLPQKRHSGSLGFSAPQRDFGLVSKQSTIWKPLSEL